MNKPKYVLTFEGVALDISRLVDSRETCITRQLCTTEFKSAVDTASFVIRYSSDELSLRSSIIGFIYSSMETQKDIEVLISLDDYSLFKGYLDLSELKLSSKRLPELISLTANDISAKLLDKTVDDYVFLEGQKISDIVKFLIAHAGGVFGSNGILASDDRVIPVFAIDRENDDDTYREYIDTLLFEAGGYVLDTDEEGWMNIVALPWENYEPTRLIDNYQLDKGLETTRKIFDKNGLKVKWSTLKETDSDQRVWTSDFSRELEGKVLVGLDVPAGGYYPEDGDITPTFQEFSADFLDREYLTEQKREKNKDLSIVAVRDVSASIVTLDSNRKVMKNEDAWDFPVLPSLKMTKNPTIYAKKAWYLLHNKTKQSVNLQLFTLEGRVLYRNKINYVTVPADADKLKEYTSTYIFTKEHAERFSSFYWHFLKNSSTIHKWSVLGDMSLGDVVQVSHKGSDIAQATLIVSAALKFVGNTAKVDCIGVALGPYNEYEVKSWGSSESIKPQAPAGADGQTPIIEYRYSESNIKPPIEKGMWLFNGKPMFFGSATLNDVNQGQWMINPRPEPGKPYRWMRVSVDSGKTYQYSCITGKDGAAARDFSIQTDALTYNLGSRGEITTPVTIKLHIERINCPVSVCTWNVQPVEIASSLEGDSIALQLPVGFKSEYIRVKATLPGVGERMLAICGVLESLPQGVYLGVYPQYDEFGNLVIYPDRAPNGPLVNGDSIVLTYIVDENGKEIPTYSKAGNVATFQKSMRYNSKDKVFVELTSRDENYSDIFSSQLADILALPSTVPSTSAAYGYFGDLAAQAAFIGRLFSNYIRVEKAIYGGSFSENGTQQEAGPGFHLGSDGKLKAVNADLTGTFSCAVMETVLNTSEKGTITQNLKESEGTRICGYPDIVEAWAFDNLPNGIGDNQWVNINWHDGTYHYTRLMFYGHGAPYREGDFYWFGIQIVERPYEPEDEAYLVIERPTRGLTPVTFPFMENQFPLYSDKIEYIVCEGVRTKLNFPRKYYVIDIRLPVLGKLPTAYTGTITIDGKTFTGTVSSQKYIKISDGVITIFDSDNSVLYSCTEFLNCYINIEYATTVTGLKAKTIYPFDNVSEKQYVGLPGKRFEAFFGNTLDCLHIYGGALPSYGEADVGELYVNDQNQILLKRN